MMAPTMTMPATISELPLPFHWLMNCGRPTVPPAPPTLVICEPEISFSLRSTWSMVRPVWSQPPPGAAGTKIWICGASCAKAGVKCVATKPAAPAAAVLIKNLRLFSMGFLQITTPPPVPARNVA